MIPDDMRRALETLGVRMPQVATPKRETPPPVERQFKGTFFAPGQEIPF
jgi:hypothetical protein